MEVESVAEAVELFTVDDVVRHKQIPEMSGRVISVGKTQHGIRWLQVEQLDGIVVSMSNSEAEHLNDG